MPNQTRTISIGGLAAVFPWILLIGVTAPVAAQGPGIASQTPYDEWRRSMPALVVQRIGSTEVSVVYNRPTARGRELFGALVPWDSIWNPGADEATRIETSADILVEGERLAAGRYSIWVIPRPEEWTVILSNSWDVQHRPFPGDEVLQFQVTPQRAHHMESLAVYFPAADVDEGVLAIHWGETFVPIEIRRP